MWMVGEEINKQGVTFFFLKLLLNQMNMEKKKEKEKGMVKPPNNATPFCSRHHSADVVKGGWVFLDSTDFYICHN